ncbi:MAG: hypothetical protein V9E94_16740 [Microthrixaceae bacterium]
MRIRRIVGAAVVATLALGAAACSGDDNADKDETTTTKAGEETTTTVAELSDDDYSAAVEPLMDDLDGAGTDLCAVLQVAYGTGPEAPPSTTEQVKVTIAAQAKILRSLAATEPVEAASAPVLNADRRQARGRRRSCRLLARVLPDRCELGVRHRGVPHSHDAVPEPSGRGVRVRGADRG